MQKDEKTFLNFQDLVKGFTGVFCIATILDRNLAKYSIPNHYAFEKIISKTRKILVAFFV